MCPCQRAGGGVTVAYLAVSRFDALSDTEPCRDVSLRYVKLQAIFSK
jgi:hypothetical protein